jgi:hypothetical protein
LEPSQKELTIVICCDADPDRERFGASTLQKNLVPLEWKGIDSGIPKLIRLVSPLRDQHGRSPAFTWLIRSDEQIKSFTGRASSFPLHQKLWLSMLQRGDECGWHPHYWRNIDDLWQQELNDPPWRSRVLTEGHQDLAQQIDIKTVKTGWCFMDQPTMNTFKELRITSDVSAMPQQKYSPERQNDKAFFGQYHWERTSTLPYFPSSTDYQEDEGISSTKAAPSTPPPLLEIPISTGVDPWITAIENMVLSFRRRQWPKPRTGQSHTSLKVSFAPFLFKRLLNSQFEKILQAPKPIVHVYFHPDECLPERGTLSHLYRAEHIAHNIKLILNMAQKKGYSTRFSTVSEFRDRYLASIKAKEIN